MPIAEQRLRKQPGRKRAPPARRQTGGAAASPSVRRGTPFTPETVQKFKGRVFVVSIGENSPAQWGVSAGAFYRTMTGGLHGGAWNRELIDKAWRSMRDEVRARGHRDVQEYYARDRFAVPIFRKVDLLVENRSEPTWNPFLLIHAPDFRALHPERAMRLLIDCYRVIAASGGPVLAPLSAGVFAGGHKRLILAACRHEMIAPAPALYGAAVVFAYDQPEYDALVG